jgi:predicted dehydrogenase
MEMNDKIKFVIIGSGNIANTYVTAIRNIEDAEVVGVISRNLNNPASYSNLPSFHSLPEIDLDFDAVIVCTPNGYHHIGTIEAASLGKHVLCEKPIDISLESIDKMIIACKKNKVKLGVAYQRRFSSDNPIVKKLIDENKIGKIFSVDLAVKNYRDDNYYDSAAYRGTYKIDGGGPFIQQASHYIDLYYWFFGKPGKLVSKLATFVHDIEVEDHGAVICLHDSGMIGTITASTATKPGFPAKMEIYTNRGYLILENDIITHWDIEGLANPSSKKTGKNMHTGSSNPLVDDTTNHEIIIKDFIDAIKTGREPLITGDSAKSATEIILDIYKNQF